MRIKSIVVMGGLSLLGFTAEAASVEWTGAVDRNWSIAENWGAGVVPGSSSVDTAILSGNHDDVVICTPIETTNSFSVTLNDEAQLRISRELSRGVDLLLGSTAGSGGGHVIQTADVTLSNDLRIGDDAAALSDSSYRMIGGALTVAEELYVNRGVLSIESSEGSLDTRQMTLTTNASLRFDFDTYGTSPIVVSDLLTIADGATLEIDLRGYSIGGNVIELIRFGAISGAFNPADITITGLGGGTLSVDGDSLNLTVVDEPQGQVSSLWFAANSDVNNPGGGLTVNTGRIIRDLTSSALSYTSAVDGDDLLYSVQWAGSDFDGDGFNDIIDFDLRVEGFTGTTYAYSTNEASSSVSALGASALPVVDDNEWGVGSDGDLDAGESLRFSVENIQVSAGSSGNVFEGFQGFGLAEKGGHSHKLIAGVGVNLPSYTSNFEVEYAVPSTDELVITSAGNTQVAAEKIILKFVVSERPDGMNGDVEDYSSYPIGAQCQTDYPAETNYLNYPEFSWDIVPRWASANGTLSSNAAQTMAAHHDVLSMGGFESEDETIADAALLKSFNPDIKTLWYVNTGINFQMYNADAFYNAAEWNKYTLDENGDRVYDMIRAYYSYNHDYPEMSEWWVDLAVEMAAQPEIDGVFIDKAGGNYPYLGEDGQFQSPVTGSEKSYYDLWDQASPGDLIIGNTIRNEREGGSRGLMQILSGSYVERWHLPYNDSPVIQSEADAKCVSIQLMREAALKGKILMPALHDRLDNSYIDDEIAAGRENELLELIREKVTVEMAYYLIIAEKYSYFRYQPDQNTEKYPEFIWDPTDYVGELTRPLGPPLGPPVKNGYIYTRSFEHVDVWLNVETDEAVLTWSDEGENSLIGEDDFDGDSLYESRTINNGINSDNILWQIVNRATVTTDELIDTSVAAGGVVALDSADTWGFLGTNKTDNVFGMYRAGGARTLVYTFDISGAEDLTLEMDWACSGDIADKNTSVFCLIDGGATQTVFEVGSSGVNWNETLDNGTVLDRNRSASVLTNGVAAPHLTDEFQTYTLSVEGTGTTLTVSIVMDSTVGGFGGFGLDNVKLYGSVQAVDGFAEWMSDFGLSGTNATESANPDGDAYTNYEEYIAGLNPSVFDTFAVSNFTAGAGNTFEWTAASGRVYNVYWSSNLVDGFSLIESNVVDGLFSDTNHVSAPAGFYKLTVGLE
ncbi:hypothetical protein PDESU_01730 [Pontiella desulfatans]|uniref:Uncharacterized protein n=1 Tax=Pontiella desulfatans TaxID=2750659 RepID=A0A6C2U1C0_PONDE|nr:putative glycoside hydrolase [Pontiella desulfatans]VGO13176.1 hypothetical protein PDESU_01730 [Pontiella desulfatans]